MSKEKQGGNWDKRITVPFLKVILMFINTPSKEYTGWDVCQQTGLKSGTVYPLLIQLEKKGWLESRCEFFSSDGEKQRRARRHLFKITQQGIEEGERITEDRNSLISITQPSGKLATS